MLKKIMKSAAALILAAALAMSLSVLAYAAGSITVFNGSDCLQLSPILVQDGRAYAPYDALFDALGAQASYDESAETITAIAGDTEITIPMDGSGMTVTVGGEEYFIHSRVLPIEDADGGRIYVPIRYAAQALGYNVAWDDEKRAIVLETIDELIAESGATYTVMDRLLDYCRESQQKNHAFDGTFELTMDASSMLYYDIDDDMDETGAEADLPEQLTISGAASGLIDQGGEELNISLKTNYADFMAFLEEDMALREEEKALIEQMGDVELDLIINAETGMTYMSSPLFTALGAEEGAWVCEETGGGGTSDLGISGLTGYSDFGFSGLMQMDGAGESFEDYVRDNLRIQILFGYRDAGEALDMLNAVYSDQAMIQEGETYTVSLASTADVYYGYSGSESMEMTISFDGGEFSEYSVVVTSASTYTYYDDSTSVTASVLSAGYSADGHGSLKLSITADDVTELSLAIDFTCTETTETPAREPAAGSTLISADELYFY